MIQTIGSLIGQLVGLSGAKDINGKAQPLLLDSGGNLLVSQSATAVLNTYSATFRTFCGSTTQALGINGAANKKITINQIKFNFEGSGSTFAAIFVLKKNSTANSGGTNTTSNGAVLPVPTPHDSNDPAAVATFNVNDGTTQFTAGTLIAEIRRILAVINPASNGVEPEIPEFKPENAHDKGFILNNATESLTLFLTVSASGWLDGFIEWTEQ